MATIDKTFLDLTGLSNYDTKIKEWANSVNQVAFKSAATDTDGNYLYLYKKPNAVVGTDTPDATISLGGGDMSAKLDELAKVCGATWNGTTKEYDITLDSTFDANTDTIVKALNELKGQINTLNANDTTAGSVAKSIKDAVEALDVSEIALTSVSSSVLSISGIKEVDGKIAKGDNSVTLAKVAMTGTAADVAIVDAGGKITATDVEGALQELAGNASGKAVYITTTAGQSTDPFSKRYGIYQGNGSAASPVAGEKIADIDIPKDMVVESGTVVTITFNSSDNKLYDGATDVTEIIKGAGGTATAADAGKYIKLIIANATSDKIYIAVKDLVDLYTAQANATEVQLAIDANNEISATIVAVNGTKVGYQYSGSVITESVSAALTRLDGNDTTTGSVAKKIKDAIAALDSTADVNLAQANGSVLTFTGSMKEVDGLIAAGDADTIRLTSISSAQINNLFN